MSHMQLHIQGPQFGWRVETKQGTEYLPDDVFSVPCCMRKGTPAWVDDSSIKRDLRDYVEADIESVEAVHGYFGRYSAPGYLDCTSWSFDTDETTLRAELEYMYEDD